MIENTKGIIFDLDGTMVDSMWMWRQIDIEFMASRNLEFTEQLQQDIEGMSFRETAEYFVRTYPITVSEEDLMKIWIDMAKDKYAHEVPLKPGIENFLQEAKKLGMKMGIATSNARELLDVVAGKYRFYDYMDAFLTANEVTRGKPAPDVYLAVAEKLGLEPKDCLVFEDIPAGIQAGLSAGMRVCAVEDAYSARLMQQKKSLAHYYITSYDEVLDHTYEVLG